MDVNFTPAAGVMKTQVAVPANSAAPGVAGTMAADTSYVYYCIALNTWRRVAVESF